MKIRTHKVPSGMIGGGVVCGALASRKKAALVSTKAASKDARPDYLLSSTGFGGLRCFAIFDATFVAQVTTFLGLSLALRGLTVFVSLFLHKASGFLDLAFNAHCRLLYFIVDDKPEKRAIGSMTNGAYDVALQKF
ncbi:MAG: hypothetical protein WAL80_01300 [Xanthobacteraceae bacterium]|jgi:hypothetical protein